jgi:methyl-accepting chemotaxis protein
VAAEAKAKIDLIAKIESAYEPVALAIVGMALKDQKTEAIAKMNTECRVLLAQLVKASDDYNAYTAARAAILTTSAEESLARKTTMLIVGSLAIILFAVFCGWRTIRAVIRPLNQAVEIVGSVAKGDLTTQITVTSKDEFGHLLEQLKFMQDNLVRLVQSVRQGSESVATASAEIAQGNLDLSSRTESQASALEQTAASMEQLGSTVRQNADNAKQADQLSQSASGKWRKKAARWCRTWSRPCAKSATVRRRLPTSPASSMRLPSRPISWP